jgi:hypothetical protein
MADTDLYPPILSGHQVPWIFESGNKKCYRLYFSLPKFDLDYMDNYKKNGADNDILTVKNLYAHVYLYNQTDQTSAVYLRDDTSAIDEDKGDDNIRVRTSGRIINVSIHQEEKGKNLFYVNIYNKDVTTDEDTNSWKENTIYKAQVRFSTVKFNENKDLTTWLKDNSNNFSEWSTTTLMRVIYPIKVKCWTFTNSTDNNILITKATNYTQSNNVINASDEITDTSNECFPMVSIRPDYNNQSLTIKTRIYSQSDIDTNKTSIEPVTSCTFVLKNSSAEILEKSNEITLSEYGVGEYQDITYNFNYIIEEENTYQVVFSFETLNGFNQTIIYAFKVKEFSANDSFPIEIYTAENQKENVNIIKTNNSFMNDNSQSIFNVNGIATNLSEIDYEEEEGYVGIKNIFSNSIDDSATGIIKRANSSSNFKQYIDIYGFNNKDIDNLIYNFKDYTAESGVWYTYAVQILNSDSSRTELNITPNPIMRNYKYSYLLGEDNQQLKISLDEKVSSFKINVSESTTTTINSKFPYVTRVGESYYKSFNIDGLISFNMDDNASFLKKTDLSTLINASSYEANGIYSSYNTDTFKRILSIYGTDLNSQLLARNHYEYNLRNGINLQSDIIYEKYFRNKVIEFLMNGKPKLFKSPTEGNIIVVLTNISLTPNEQLKRLIYSFSATATEIADATIDNYAKYNFIKGV